MSFETRLVWISSNRELDRFDKFECEVALYVWFSFLLRDRGQSLLHAGETLGMIR